MEQIKIQRDATGLKMRYGGNDAETGLQIQLKIKNNWERGFFLREVSSCKLYFVKNVSDQTFAGRNLEESIQLSSALQAVEHGGEVLIEFPKEFVSELDENSTVRITPLLSDLGKIIYNFLLIFYSSFTAGIRVLWRRWKKSQ